MTEAEWLASEDPRPMLWHTVCSPGERKFRLFACAALRRVADVQPGGPAARALWAAEMHADRRLTDGELLDAREGLDLGPPFAHLLLLGAGDCARSVVDRLAADARELARAADALREVVGTPMRPAPLLPRVVPCDRCNGKGQRTLGRTCGTCEGHGTVGTRWPTPVVLALAQAAYHGACRDCGGTGRVELPGDSGHGPWPEPCFPCRGTGWLHDGELDPARLAVLSDALEDAGCDNADLLAHLRGFGPHTLGCWALDLILGKE
jgi:hypothetical protein